LVVHEVPAPLLQWNSVVLKKKITQKVGGVGISKLSDSLISGLYIDENSARIP